MIFNYYIYAIFLTFSRKYIVFITHWLSISYISAWFSMGYKGSKILKKKFGKVALLKRFNKFYTPVPPWLSTSYASDTTVWSFPGGISLCQIVAQGHNSLKINPLHRLPKQSTLYNLYKYLKINALHTT